MTRHDERRRLRLQPLTVWVSAACVAALAGVSAGPSRFGFSDRVERHLFPEVTSGPADPVWSPDGRSIAFSMQGDIWVVPAAGGVPVALTEGPWYYFEPAWSADGRSVAFTVDTGGNLDIGVVGADGTGLRRLTDDRAVDFSPEWSRDGSTVYFVSSRSRGFDIFGLTVADGSTVPVIGGPGDQLQPAVSPDGLTLAYVSPVRGRLGTGGIWTRSLRDGSAEPVLVHYEESEYRLRPRWTPDGRAFVYGTDEMGSNDIATVPVGGGNPVVITNDPMGEFSPAVSPDGRSLAFISNRSGPMTLHTATIDGGPVSSWKTIATATRQPKRPAGTVQISVEDAGGRVVPARIHLRAVDGRSYAPDDGFARVTAVTETHYFHMDGRADVVVPAGRVTVEAVRGFSHVPVVAEVDVPAGGTGSVRLTLGRSIAEPDLTGWHSGDTHAHDLHQGRFGLTHRTLFLQSQAEDLHVSNVLIHMDGTRLMGRWADLSGEPHPLSTPTHILQFAQEFRGALGHIGLLGVSRFVLPLTSGTGNTVYSAWASDLPYLDGAREQGGIAGFMHPYLNAGRDAAGWAGSLIPVDVALGRGDFYDVASLYSDELASAEMYYRLLNSGFRLPATGGTDNFPDVWRDPPPGTDRTFARVDGRLSVASWLAAVRAGRTFATNGPLITRFLVDGQPAGADVKVPSRAPVEHVVEVSVASIAPVDRIDVVVNGQVAASAVAEGGTSPTAGTGVHALAFRGRVSLPEGGWVAARVVGPSSRYVADSYAFAHTSPVYVAREGQPPFVSAADAAFLADVVAAIRARAERVSWRTEASRAAFLAELDRASEVYRARAGSR